MLGNKPMMMDTFELGPILHSPVPDFILKDHDHKERQLTELCGSRGALLGFIGSIWQPASVRRVFWLQRHAARFTLMGAPVVLLVRDSSLTLYGFRQSSPLPVPFLMLADTSGDVHRQCRMDRHAGLILVDRQLSVQAKWMMPDDRVWPKLNEVTRAVEELPRESK